ncbi:hypothetical protein CLOM_g12181 [Closterium sp. NIES-68]|nr:hypothetical protein CLOM_g12181 [Closterium sp. NIES-68]
MDLGLVRDGEAVEYRDMRERRALKRGRLSRQGVTCDCCGRMFNLSGFEAHTGVTYRRPAANMFLEDGRTLAACKLEAEKSFGQLVLPACRCSICGGSHYRSQGFGDDTVIFCDQCEREYHVSCLRDRGWADLKELPTGRFFCRPQCRTVFFGLQRLIGKPIALPGGFSWTLLHAEGPRSEAGGVTKEARRHDSLLRERTGEVERKLRCSMEVMRECFHPIKDAFTNEDLVPIIVHSKSTKHRDYSGRQCCSRARSPSQPPASGCTALSWRRCRSLARASATAARACAAPAAAAGAAPLIAGCAPIPAASCPRGRRHVAPGLWVCGHVSGGAAAAAAAGRARLPRHCRPRKAPPTRATRCRPCGWAVEGVNGHRRVKKLKVKLKLQAHSHPSQPLSIHPSSLSPNCRQALFSLSAAPPSLHSTPLALPPPGVSPGKSPGRAVRMRWGGGTGAIRVIKYKNWPASVLRQRHKQRLLHLEAAGQAAGRPGGGVEFWGGEEGEGEQEDTAHAAAAGTGGHSAGAGASAADSAAAAGGDALVWGTERAYVDAPPGARTDARSWTSSTAPTLLLPHSLPMPLLMPLHRLPLQRLLLLLVTGGPG